MVDKLERLEILREFEVSPGKMEKGFFVKSFLVDETVNKNKWRVTTKSIKRDIHTYLDKRFSPVGKTMPFFLELDETKPEFMDHPKATEKVSVFVKQEDGRVGDMIAVGYDEQLQRAWQASRIDDPAAQDAIDRGDVLYVSPGLRSLEEHIDENGIAVVTRFIGQHIAGVIDPAYGIEKAKIVGTCDDDSEFCINYFKDIKASSKNKYAISKCSKTGNILIEIAHNTDDCISQILSKKLSKGESPTKEDLAAAFTECNKNSSSSTSDTSLKKSSESQNNTMTMSEQELKTKEDELNKKASELEQKEKKFKDAKNASDEAKKDKEDKKAETVSPNEDGSCPKGFTKGEDGMCHLQSSDNSAKVASLQSQVSDLKATVDSQIKKPIAEKIASVKVELGTVSQKDYSASVTELMAKPLKELESLQRDYVAINESRGVEETNEPRYTYNVDDKSASSEKEGQAILAQIRGRMNAL